jgi:putative flavoprotein involved in K+ transport
MPRNHERLDAVIVGGGFHGLGVSAALQRAGLSHRVLERARPCETWRSQRWDSFRMNTPNVQTVMPGDAYAGDDPEGFLTRDAFVAMILDFADRHALPVETGTAVTAAEPDGDGGFRITTAAGTLRARNLVAATGNLNVARRPAFAARLPASVTQIDGPDYRAAAALRPGGVLVVGCGNSGSQIAEDLALAGREVWLATGRNGRVPRRDRGRDILLWLMENGRYHQPRTTRSGRPLLGAGHTLSLALLSALGIRLLGRLEAVTPAGEIVVAGDLAEHAAFADAVSAGIRREIDDWIAANGIAAEAAVPDPAETIPARFPDPPVRGLDLAASGITTVIWCTGFLGDYRWLRVPGATDAAGQPVAARCLSVPGVTFPGLDSMEALKSGTIMVVDEDSRRIADTIAARL